MYKACITLFFFLAEPKASHLLGRCSTIEPLHQSFSVLDIFLRKGFANNLPGVASNCDSPDLCLQSSKDYRHKAPVPGMNYYYNEVFLSYIC
jgi:hypothetical protein